MSENGKREEASEAKGAIIWHLRAITLDFNVSIARRTRASAAVFMLIMMKIFSLDCLVHFSAAAAVN
jgi:hypothetical protein